VALKYPDGKKVTFQQLESLSNQFAAYLTGKGIQKQDVVALFNEKSPHAYAAMIACLKIGAIYTNLDINSPASRILKIFDRCQPKLLFNDCGETSLLTEIQQSCNCPVVELDDPTSEGMATYPAQLPDQIRWITGNDPAYIMFTSGSTGFPKGAVISHANLLNFIHWGKDEFEITTEDIFTNVNPVYFDNSVFDFYVSLLNGATLAPISSELAKQPKELIKAVGEVGCTSWFSVPSLLVYLLTTKALEKGRLPNLRRFIFGGEGFPKPKLQKLYQLFGDTATLYNVYGPTECTCICSCYVIGDKDFDDLTNFAPLGYLTPNFDYEILDEDEQTPGFGELFLKGPNVGLGYYNDPERMDNAFIQNPLNDLYREIGYRTGDLVQRDEIGHLHFKGRADNQVKHMGYRIELEEIEAALNSLKDIDEAAVIYKKMGEGMGQILAFANAGQSNDENAILSELKDLLPDYMIPKRIYILNPLPKNQNGKIDRVALENY